MKIKIKKRKKLVKTAENNYGAPEFIYITAQKNRPTPQYCCLAESELPQIPGYYLEAEYNHPDMTSPLYTPWMPDDFDESLIERYSEKPVEKDSDKVIIEINEQKDKDHDKGENKTREVELVKKSSKDSIPGIMLTEEISENPDTMKKSSNDNIPKIILTEEISKDPKIMKKEEDNDDDDDEDKPLIDDVSHEHEPIFHDTKQEHSKPEILIDVNLPNEGSDDNIYKSLPSTAYPDGPDHNESNNNVSEENQAKKNKRETIYLDT